MWYFIFVPSKSPPGCEAQGWRPLPIEGRRSADGNLLSDWKRQFRADESGIGTDPNQFKDFILTESY
jgi:hypothetical protein